MRTELHRYTPTWRHGARSVLALCLLGLAACGDPKVSGGGTTTPIPVPGASLGPPVDTIAPPATLPCDADPMTPSAAARRAFPATVPSTAGYKLVNAFPGVTPGLELPIAVAWPSSGGPIVLELKGKIVQIDGTTKRVLVDFGDEVNKEGEAGALGMTLHPQFGNGTGPQPYVYVWYNAQGWTQRLTRYTYDATNRRLGGRRVLLDQAETTFMHNGGRIFFGADGFLYFGNGDDLNDENDQTLSRALFSGLFRIDVDKRGGTVSHAPPRRPAGTTVADYYIPNDNPFVGVPNALEEFFALGLRNPFGIGFDSKTGEIYVADVGETWREEINRIVPGGNYEWPFREGGVVRTEPPARLIGTRQPPLYAYSHASVGDLSALLGGYVYRGKALPELDGKYIYSEWPTGRVWAADVQSPIVTTVPLIENAKIDNARGFAQDLAGELYVLQLNAIARIERDSSRDAVPQRLSESEIFEDTAAFTLAPGFEPYTVNSPLWSDHAEKPRYVRVPAGKRITVNGNGQFVFPDGTLFVKQFNLPADQRRETRVIVKAQDDFYTLGYRWNCSGTDAKLVVGDNTTEADWHFPSFGQCWACHRAENRILGFNPGQLDDVAGQIQRLKDRGVLDMGSFKPTPLTVPTDTRAPIEARALAYLAANCGGCHHEGASFHGGEPTWIATPGVPLESRGLLRAPHHNYPVAAGLEIPFAPLIDPGKPENSLLLARMKTTHQDLQMPPLARMVPDETGVRIVEEWIRSLRP